MRKTPEIETISYTNDLVFPAVPKIKANCAAELTEKEFEAMVIYIIKAENCFDIISEREKQIENAGR